MKYLLHDLFHHSVNEYPNNIAIIEEQGKTTSYKELNIKANDFCSILTHAKKSLIGIISEVNCESIAAILGILKLGATYVPLDTKSPVDRLKVMVLNLGLDTIIVDSNIVLKFKDLFDSCPFNKIVIFGDDNYRELKSAFLKNENTVFFNDFLLSECRKVNMSTHTKPQVSDDLAYVLHSSGSTGIPKGIMLTHRNARTFVDWMQKEFKLTKNDILMSRAPFKFDLSVFDIFNTLAVGAKIVCFDWNKKRKRDQKHIDYVNLMIKEMASVIYTTPSTLITLLNRGGLGDQKTSLRTIMYAGEPFPIPQLIELKSRLKEAKIANIYGPTETNIITYYWVNEVNENWTSIPLGRVVDDTEILVVNEAGNRECDVNEIGELWCRGGTVTLGYIGLDDLTSQCLVSSPFHSYPAKYWKTGDFGYLDENGDLHYKGRKDHMIKLNGYRIEFGEVESAMSKLSEIFESCVVHYKNALVCCYSTKDYKIIPSSCIVDALKPLLPEYMIPKEFKHYDELPKTSSGKIDRILLEQEVKI
ncbi:amino acid adenylation domain-containing protein [Aeromonas lacus]